MIDPSAVDALYDAMEHEQFNRWLFFQPYPKQRAFMDAGATFLERLLTAGNQTGKSDTGAYETARHLTGVYPAWWKGRRYDQNSGPCNAWVGGPSGIAVRDGPQRKLFGEPGVADLLGTGFIPKDAIVGEPSSGRSATASIDTAHIRHVSGAVVSVSFKTYEQDRRHWQGPTKNFIWFDEEPPLEIYTEGLARLAATGGSHILTFTPLFGFSDVVKRFLECPPEYAYRRTSVQMSLTDAKHMTPELIQATLSIYPQHEWAARRDGDPHLSGGLVFSTAPTDLAELPFSLTLGSPGRNVPTHWRFLWSIDFGIDHPFAAVLLGLDPDNDTGHILAGFKVRDTLPLVHADRMRRIAANVPVAWPHDGHVRDKGSGEELAAIYRKHGLQMLGEHATFNTGGYSTEAGITDLDVAMRSGRFKVNAQFEEWFQEYRLYHREVLKDGSTKIAKTNDDLMSATRIGWMMRRAAKAVPLGSKVVKRHRDEKDVVINPWTGRVDQRA